MLRNRPCAAPLRLAILLLFLVGLTSCAKNQPVVVLGDSQTFKLEAGQPAPTGGWLLSDSAMVELLECCGDKLEGTADAHP